MESLTRLSTRPASCSPFSFGMARVSRPAAFSSQSGSRMSGRTSRASTGVTGKPWHVCPDCDGYETRDKKTVVVGKGRKAVGMALALTTWTRAIVICTNGEKPDMDEELLNQLKALNVPVLDAPIECVVSDAGEIRHIDLKGGNVPRLRASILRDRTISRPTISALSSDASATRWGDSSSTTATTHP